MCNVSVRLHHHTDRTSDGARKVKRESLPCWSGNSPNRSQSVTYMNPRLKGELDKIWRPSQSPQDWRHESVAPKKPVRLLSLSLSLSRSLSLPPSLSLSLSPANTHTLPLFFFNSCKILNRAESSRRRRRRGFSPFKSLYTLRVHLLARRLDALI